MKRIIAIVLVIVLCVAFCGCNRVGIFGDFHNEAKWAEVRHPDGSASVYELDKWSQDEGGYTLVLKNGNVLFVNGVNCILSKEPIAEDEE